MRDADLIILEILKSKRERLGVESMEHEKR